MSDGEIKSFYVFVHSGCELLVLTVCLAHLFVTVSAQEEEQPCLAPQLDGGCLIPRRQTYPHESKLHYTCGEGQKPPVEGWWATSTCENGKWSPEPQCMGKCSVTSHNPTIEETGDRIYREDTRNYETELTKTNSNCSIPKIEFFFFSSFPTDETACLPPTIPNGKYIENQNGWYAEHHNLMVTCHDGYELKGNSGRSRCINGTWSSLPVCESKCGRVPIVRHGVLMRSERNSLTYECQSYYKRVGPDTVVCYGDGTWSEVPTCIAAFCSVITDALPHLYPAGVKLLEEGSNEKMLCKPHPDWWTNHYSLVHCINGQVRYSKCKFSFLYGRKGDKIQPAE
uniref:Sushi domain-containing protein n=1 Tax=Stegastes partitus TaxID=144197 RepID=A0A3B4Z984_9TELE